MTARLEVVVRPRSKQTGIEGRRADGRWKLAVAAPPEDGKANAAVAKLLAESLGVKARDVEVLRGHGSREKLIEVRGIEQGDLERRLGRALEDRGSDDGD